MNKQCFGDRSKVPVWLGAYSKLDWNRWSETLSDGDVVRLLSSRSRSSGFWGVYLLQPSMGLHPVHR